MSIEQPQSATLAVLMLATACAALPAHAQSAQRSLAFVSEPGDPIGQGRTATVLPHFLKGAADAIFVAGYDGAAHYNLMLVPPDGQRLRVGAFENARGGAEYAPGHPYLEFTSDQACDGYTGRFEITELAFDASGYITRLRVNFEQRCGGASGTLWGDLALDAALTSYDAVLEKFATIDAGDPRDAIAHLVVQCNARAFGGLRVSAVQKAPHGSSTTGGTVKDFFCGTSPTRVALELPSTAAWRPGPVDVAVESFLDDPHYDEGARPVRKTVLGTVVLRHTHD